MRFHYRHIPRGCQTASLCYLTFSTSTELEVLGWAMELPVCGQEGRHHCLCLPTDSPHPGPYWDLDQPRKHWHSSCHLICLLLFALHLPNAHPETPSPTLTSDGLTCFSPRSSEDVLTLVTSNRASTHSLDPIPSSLFQDISHNILPFLTTLVNSSLTSGIIVAPFKAATLNPLLKKPTLADIWNYRLLSLLSFLFKPWNVQTISNFPIFQIMTSLTLISQA